MQAPPVQTPTASGGEMTALVQLMQQMMQKQQDQLQQLLVTQQQAQKDSLQLIAKMMSAPLAAPDPANPQSTERPSVPASGGWWSFSSEADVKAGPVAVESGNNCYVMAMDNGRFTVGAPHSKGEEPLPEEVLTLIKTPDSNTFSLKSGYGKYVGVNSVGLVVATADAIGPREKWELVFEDGKCALQATCSNCFLTSETDTEGYLYASAKTARQNEMIKLRTNQEKEKPVDYTPDEDRKQAKDQEVAYVKKYQHSKVNLNPDTIRNVKVAKAEGNTHEVLLDRRIKMKADRYCK